MAQGTGYICSWTVGNKAGRIHVCDGSNKVGDTVAFALAGCSPALQAVLNAKSISEGEDCPPPAGSLGVSFDFDFQGGMDLLVNVRPL